MSIDKEGASVHTTVTTDLDEKHGFHSVSVQTASAPDELDQRYADMFKRHGRTDLIPMPSDSPVDPLNWPAWRKNVLLAIVAFHTMIGPLGAAILIPAFDELVVDLGITLAQAPYLVSIQILFMAIAPILISPLSSRIGRRPIYLVSAFFSASLALAGAFTQRWGSLITTRIFQAIVVSPPLSIGAQSVHDTTFAHERGKKMGVWVLMVATGPVIGPLMSGYLVQYYSWRSALYLLAGMNLLIFFLHLFFAPETLFPSRTSPGTPYSEDEVCLRSSWRAYTRFKVYDRTPFRAREFYGWLGMFGRPGVVLTTLAYAMTLMYTVALMTIFVPQVFGAVFSLTPGQIGLQFIALLIGAALGELVAGPSSDAFVNWRARSRLRTLRSQSSTHNISSEQNETVKSAVWHPEDRLILAPPGFILAIVGLMIWGVRLQEARAGVWNVTPDIGAAIALFGAQFGTTMCVTYTVESVSHSGVLVITDGEEQSEHDDAVREERTAEIGVFIGFVRHMYAFASPFYLSGAYTKMGDTRASGLFAGLIGVAMMMVIACIVWGRKWRTWKHAQS
ncbi:MFS general substrate transporter [Coniophora puteana RWD-64-598 SS2]|uniref:MFS general substrate transporter n=1 Tax=Coniophora puteana (strain RWD-64-598) TaxID=741705 RepID=A0A5M3N3A8_CONPW|nr:MFS general substrate transporter [Coniophora puteana RWD-64-598 SS2]EIW85848.1 MFS general substrate transporter [Coniophora puteana RWD-64-598 SS2]